MNLARILRRHCCVLLIAAALGAPPVYAQHAHDPPRAEVADYDFNFPALGITAATGTWAQANGTFNSTSTGYSIATINEYASLSAAGQPSPTIRAADFTFRARMRNPSSNGNTRVGIVYLFQDVSNYYEASFSPTGTAYLRRVQNGVATTFATASYAGGGSGAWFDAEVAWTPQSTDIKVNGIDVFSDIGPHAYNEGRVGLLSDQTTARFDLLLATVPFGDQNFRADFSSGAPANWEPLSGSWGVANGAYQNSAVAAANIVLLPIETDDFNHTGKAWEYTLYSRMLNPYGAAGNRLGFVYNYRAGGGTVEYNEVVFGGDGIARANRVVGSAVTNLASAPYGVARNQWFDVKLEVSNVARVAVNGQTLFPQLFHNHPGGHPLGGVGLITRWAPGRFDDVWFEHGVFEPVELTFDDGEPPPAQSGTWDIQGGTLNNRSAGASDVVSLSAVGQTTFTDYKASARMLNPYGASGNRVGLRFNFGRGGDYHEVTLAPTGEAYLVKFVQGVRGQLAFARHSIGRNVWFTLEVHRHGPYVTVKANGATLFQSVPAAQLDKNYTADGTTSIFVVSQWSPARFDEVRITRTR